MGVANKGYHTLACLMPAGCHDKKGYGRQAAVARAGCTVADAVTELIQKEAMLRARYLCRLRDPPVQLHAS